MERDPIQATLASQTGEDLGAARQAGPGGVGVSDLTGFDLLDRLDREHAHPGPQRAARLHRRTPPAAEGERDLAVRDSPQRLLVEKHGAKGSHPPRTAQAPDTYTVHQVERSDASLVEAL